jgi:hypothetical protein
MRSRLLAAALVMGVLFALGTAASPMSAAQPAPPPAPNLLPCAQPGPYKAAGPAHPYQPGDPSCDARQFGVVPGFIKQPTTPRKPSRSLSPR